MFLVVRPRTSGGLVSHSRWSVVQSRSMNARGFTRDTVAIVLCAPSGGCSSCPSPAPFPLRCVAVSSFPVGGDSWGLFGSHPVAAGGVRASFSSRWCALDPRVAGRVSRPAPVLSKGTVDPRVRGGRRQHPGHCPTRWLIPPRGHVRRDRAGLEFWVHPPRRGWSRSSDRIYSCREGASPRAGGSLRSGPYSPCSV